MRLVPKRLRWMGVGALVAYLFDPERGRARRNQLADRASELKRKAGLERTPGEALDKAQDTLTGDAIGAPSSPKTTTNATTSTG